MPIVARKNLPPTLNITGADILRIDPLDIGAVIICADRRSAATIVRHASRLYSEGDIQHIAMEDWNDRQHGLTSRVIMLFDNDRRTR